MRTGRAPSPRRIRSRTLAAAVLAIVTTTACGGAQEPVAPLPVDPAPVTGTVGAPAPTRPALPGARSARAGPASCVDATLARLDDRGRAAQLVMMGVPADGVTEAARAGLGQAPGGIILTDPEQGGEATRAGVRSAVDEAQAAARSEGGGVPLLVSTDQEGGKVQDLAGSGFDTMPSALEQGRDVAGLEADARRWGNQLSGAGVTVNLAPVADVVDPALGTANAPVGQYGRGFGTDVGRVSGAVEAFVRGMGAGGAAPTLKHFPGLGKVRENTDFAGGVADDATTRRDPDLASFRDGIAAGAPLVMMSSARYTKIDDENLALFSPTIMQDVLRGDLGFRGVIMTDDVGAAAALADVPVGRRATDFVAAGGNLVLTIRPSDAEPMVDALAGRAGSDPAFAAKVDDSARRVLALKETRGVLRC